MTGKTRQAFANGFLGVGSFGRCTFAVVTEAAPGVREEIEFRLAGYFVAHYGAPDLDAALPAAREEVDFIAELCRDAPINTVFIVRRALDSAGRIKEDFAPSRLRRADLGMPASGWWSPIEALCLKEKVMGAR